MKYPELKQRLIQLNPKGTYQLDEATTIIDSEKFINSHFKIIEANPKNRNSVAYYNRLLRFLIFISNKTK